MFNTKHWPQDVRGRTHIISRHQDGSNTCNRCDFIGDDRAANQHMVRQQFPAKRWDDR